MKTPHAVAAVLLVLTLAGCADQPMASIEGSASAIEYEDAGLQKLEPLPLRGHCETTFNPMPLPPPPVHRQIDTGICRLTHLGRAEFYSVKDIDIKAGTQTTEASFTAADGDILRAVGSGTSAPVGPGRVSFSATLTFVGGTGRFVHATGEAHVVGEAALFTRTATFEILGGSIDYDASDRSGS